MQYSEENTHVGVFSLTLLKRDHSTGVSLLRNYWRTSAYSCFWTNSRKWLFGTVSGMLLSKQSLLGNITKIPVAFKSELLAPTSPLQLLHQK